MYDRRPLKLDSAGLRGRMKSSSYQPRPVVAPRRFSDVVSVKQFKPVMVQQATAKTTLKPLAKRSLTLARPASPRRQSTKVLARQVVQSKPFVLPAKPKRKSLVPIAIVSMAITIFVFGLFVTLSGWRTNKEVKAQVAGITKQVQSDETDVPDETNPPTNLEDYQVAPTMPRLLKIEKLDVEARIKRLGVKANNEISAPSNIYDAGWYEGSAKPGEAGAALIDGHVHGPTKPGIFMNLKKLVDGDKIEVERGDGKVLTYKVVKTETYPVDQVDMAAALTTAENGKNGLNLITCSGKIDKDNHYTERLVVFAVQE